MKITALLFLAVTLLSTAEAAQIELKNRFGLGAGIGAAIPVGASVLKNSSSTGLSAEGHADYYLSNALGLELAYHRLNFKAAAPASNTYTLGAVYRFFETSILTPVAGIGAGYQTTSGSGIPMLNFKGFVANAKLGLDYAINNNWVAGLSAKYQWLFSDLNGSFNEHSIAPQVNLTYFFDSSKTGATAVAATTAAVAAVATVDGDDDHDGVLNSVDQCANTAAGTKVNSLGCSVKEKVNFTINVEFDAGKSEIKAAYHDELNKMAELLKAHTDLNSEIQGFTDATGNKANNVKLSAARAKAVRDYLVNKLGVEGSRLTSKGFGPAQPIADNKTAEGRAKNRRVVASLRSK